MKRYLLGILGAVAVSLFLASPAAAAGPLDCGTMASPPGTIKGSDGAGGCSDAQVLNHKLQVEGSFSAGIATYSTTDKGGTITTGGTAQNAIASNASRKMWCIQNDPSATEILSVRLNGTASATAGTILQAGQQACSAPGYIDTAAVSVFGATTGHRFFGFEGQ